MTYHAAAQNNEGVLYVLIWDSPPRWFKWEMQSAKEYTEDITICEKNYTYTYMYIYMYLYIYVERASLVAQTVKNLPAMQETWVWYICKLFYVCVFT